MIGLRDTRNKPAIVFNAVHALAEPTLIGYSLLQLTPTIRQALNDEAIATLTTFTIGLLSATAFQRTDVSSAITLETLAVDLFDVTVVTEILELPNLVPTTDVSVGDWTVAPLWSKVNTLGSTTTWISSSNSTNSACRIRLSVPNAASAGVLHFFRRKTTGNDPDFTWELFRDGVSIQSSTISLTNTAFIESTYPLNENIVAGAIYEVVCTRSGGGNPQQRGILQIASLYIDPV